MPFPDVNHPWESRPIGDIFRLSTIGIKPQNMPTELFYHYSIPAIDRFGGPALEQGQQIDSNKFLLVEDCILVSKLNPQINRAVLFTPHDGDERCCASTELMAYVPTAENVDLHFYLHYTKSARFRKNLISVATGTTNSHKRARPSETLRWIVPFPPLEEQSAIAQILDAVDTTTVRTNDTLKQAIQLGRSLTLELLQYGVDENSKLRDKSVKSEFTNTKMGSIPVDWNVSSIGQEFELQTGFTINQDRRPRINKRRYLRVANVHRDQIFLDDVQELEAKDSEIENRTLTTGDILIVEGHANRMEIGRAAMVTEQSEGLTFQNHLFRLRSLGKVEPYFGCLWMNSVYAMKYWNARCATSSGLNTINQRMLKRLSIPVPSISEQLAIIEIVDSHRGYISALREKSRRLVELKTSLMHDLLTGKVRVSNIDFDQILGDVT